jgi:hypothetical protein
MTLFGDSGNPPVTRFVQQSLVKWIKFISAIFFRFVRMVQ